MQAMGSAIARSASVHPAPLLTAGARQKIHRKAGGTPVVGGPAVGER